MNRTKQTVIILSLMALPLLLVATYSLPLSGLVYRAALTLGCIGSIVGYVMGLVAREVMNEVAREARQATVENT